MPKMRFEVTINTEDLDLYREEVASYILDAVQCWKGGMNPNGELFQLDYRKMSVKDPHTKIRYIDTE